ncbi:nucleotide exchange factor GrpE [Sunxiuqinia elliptica]|uniref:Protein GrpE n=1 Tax=Sunxiuqinia elliptica TaxID=655355 RepID=A0A4R6HB53_9BACT|nr:nucleotide exchange factor GrpE [Sunxiuqinia elliptica]TDO05178.1 molecular chaperone GrpE [Sunxiuqinia elliptica]TDO64727.1 molecular chaperone GrpE [Sunxiuqinia elliptica]
MADEKIKQEQELENETEINGNEAQTQEETADPDKKDKKAKAKKEHKKSKKDDASEKVEALGQELISIKDKHIRLQAEFDNYRKRTMKEKMDLIKSGGESVLVNILPIIDDFERALTAFSEMKEDDPLKTGVTLIYNKFKDFLKQNGVTEIEALEQEFDTDLHEAVTKIPAPKDELKGKVVDVIQKGYQMNEKVIRFSKVVVGE